MKTQTRPTALLIYIVAVTSLPKRKMLTILISNWSIFCFKYEENLIRDEEFFIRFQISNSLSRFSKRNRYMYSTTEKYVLGLEFEVDIRLIKNGKRQEKSNLQICRVFQLSTIFHQISNQSTCSVPVAKKPREALRKCAIVLCHTILIL